MILIDYSGIPESGFSAYKSHLGILTDHRYMYCKVPKFSDERKPCCNQPKIQTKRQNLRAFCQKDANGKGNSEDPDQTAHLGAV